MVGKSFMNNLAQNNETLFFLFLRKDVYFPRYKRFWKDGGGGGASINVTETIQEAVKSKYMTFISSIT